jgi:hypothetical protein
MKNFLLIVFTSLIIAGCTGTGLTTYGDYVRATKISENSDVVVYRQPGFVGGGTIFTITLNGAELGTIGNDEFLIGEMQEGRNILNVEVKGIQGFGLNKPTKTFEKTIERNIYFKVGYSGGVNAPTIFIQEISPQEFRRSAAN